MHAHLVPALAAGLAVASLAAPATAAVEPVVHVRTVLVPDPTDASYVTGACVAVTTGLVALTAFTYCGTRDAWDYRTVVSGPVAVATFSSHPATRVCWSGYVVPVLDPTPVPFEGCS